jgi:hypothetical protein
VKKDPTSARMFREWQEKQATEGKRQMFISLAIEADGVNGTLQAGEHEYELQSATLMDFLLLAKSEIESHRRRVGIS